MQRTGGKGAILLRALGERALFNSGRYLTQGQRNATNRGQGRYLTQKLGQGRYLTKGAN